MDLNRIWVGAAIIGLAVFGWRLSLPKEYNQTYAAQPAAESASADAQSYQVSFSDLVRTGDEHRFVLNGRIHNSYTSDVLCDPSDFDIVGDETTNPEVNSDCKSAKIAADTSTTFVMVFDVGHSRARALRFHVLGGEIGMDGFVTVPLTDIPFSKKAL